MKSKCSLEERGGRMKVWKWIIWVLLILLIAGITVWPVMAKLTPPTPSPYGKERVKPNPDSPPIPESELTHIVIPESWLINNDQDERPEIIKIAVPKSWLDNPPKVDENEPVVLLRIPKMMLYDFNTIFNTY